MISEQRKAETKMPGQRMYIEGYCPKLFIELIKTLPMQPTNLELKFLAKGIANFELKDKPSEGQCYAYVEQCNQAKVMPFSEDIVKYNFKTNTFVPPGYDITFNFGQLSRDVSLQEKILESYIDVNLGRSYRVIINANPNEKNKLFDGLNLNKSSDSAKLEAEVQERVGESFQKFKALALLDRLFQKDYHLFSGEIDLNSGYSRAEDKFFSLGGTKFGYNAGEDFSFFKLGGVFPEHHQPILNDWFESLKGKYVSK